MKLSRKMKIQDAVTKPRPTVDITWDCPGCGKPPEEYRDKATMVMLPGMEAVADEDTVFCSGCAAQVAKDNGWATSAVFHAVKKTRTAKAQSEGEKSEDAASKASDTD